MYKAIDVWRRVDNTRIARYRCFNVLTTQRFCVQSVDFYYLPLDETQIGQLEKQFIELLFDEAPEIRTETYPTLEEAIKAHDNEFDNP